MARRRRAQRRETPPDPKFNSPLVQKFVNKIMWDGKKILAQRIFYEALEQAAKMVKVEDQMAVFTKAMENVRPVVEVRSRRVGGATYQVPVEVPPYRQDALAIRWLVTFARGRKGVPMAKALAQELADAYNNQGNAVKKREDTHRMAEANRAFAHYRW
ncbi:MAG: 30S ribosomal protein S7 [bacterium]|nr:30S ribosomal protein S7 [bacterium]